MTKSGLVRLWKGTAGLFLAVFSINAQALPNCAVNQAAYSVGSYNSSFCGPVPFPTVSVQDTLETLQAKWNAMEPIACPQVTNATILWYKVSAWNLTATNQWRASWQPKNNGSNFGYGSESIIYKNCEPPPPPPPTCTAGQTAVFNGSNSSATPPSTGCKDQCSYAITDTPTDSEGYNVQPGLYINIINPDATYTWRATYKKTGANCPAGDNSGNFTTPADENTITANGTTVTINPTEKNCGLVNGEKICVAQQEQKNCGTVNGDHYCAGTKNCGYVNGTYECGTTLTAGNCITTRSGAAICVTKGTTPITPPAPNNGSAGTTANPTAIYSLKDSNNSTVNYYNKDAVTASTTRPPLGSSSDSSAKPSDPTKTGCGAEGQAPCNQKIDETGMPSGNNAYDAAAIANSIASGNQSMTNATTSNDAATQSTGLGNALSGLLGFLQPSTCTPLEVNFMSYSMTFPSTQGCALLEQLKVILDWLLALVAAYSIAGIAFRSE